MSRCLPVTTPVAGHASMGPYAGGQAEYLRVSWADFNALVLPEGADLENDYTLLSDVFPAGWHGVELARPRPGETIVIPARDRSGWWPRTAP